LDWQVDCCRRLAGLFNDLIVVEVERIPDEAPPVTPLREEEIEEAGRALAAEQATYLIDLAKANALRSLGEPNAAAEVMQRRPGG